MTDEAPYRITIIGAGPRGLSVYERLVALASAKGPEALAQRPLEIHLVDPFPPGPGIVWRTDQDPNLLMNTTIGEQTVFPDPSCRVSPDSTGPDMGTWYRERGGTADPASTFGSRALYGEYLEWSYEHIRTSAPAHVTTIHHPQRATAIVEPAGIDPAGAEVRDSVLLDGAVVEQGVRLRNCIVAPGARVAAGPDRGTEGVITLIGHDGTIDARVPFDHGSPLPALS